MESKFQISLARFWIEKALWLRFSLIQIEKPKIQNLRPTAGTLVALNITFSCVISSALP